MRRSAIAASLLLATSIPALAGSLDALRDSLDHLPATLMFEDRGDLAYFIDIQAVLALSPGEGEAQPYMRLMHGAQIPALDSLQYSAPAEWEAKAGTTLDQVRYFTGYGRPPDVYSFWGLADEAAATEMIVALKGLGFESAAAGVVGNGEPLRMDPAKRNPADPWRTGIGAAQFAAAKGSNIVQTGTPQTAMLAAAQQPGPSENAIIETALAGLDQSVGDNTVVQALVISPLFGMAGIDHGALLSGSPDIEATKKRIEEQMAALDQGIPPYLGGIAADVQGEQPGVDIALTYPDCDSAEDAVGKIAARWADMAGDTAQGNVSTTTVEGVDGLCAATFSVTINSDGVDQNPAYRALIEPMFRGQAGVLQIGAS